MTLQIIRQLRLNGGKPIAVRVFIGARPAWIPDSPAELFIAAADDLQQLDLRPLVECRFTVIALDPDNDRLLAVTKAVIDAGAVFMGAVCDAGATGVYKDHEATMLRYREDLCR